MKPTHVAVQRVYDPDEESAEAGWQTSGLDEALVSACSGWNKELP